MDIVRFDINAQVGWRAVQDAETGAWVGVCDSLKLTAQGATWEEMTRRIAEVQNELMLDLLAEGTLNDFLTDHGWKVLTPMPVASHDIRFDLPSRVAPERHAHS